MGIGYCGAVSTAVGAFIPIVAFFFISGVRAFIFAAIVSLTFAVGAAKSLMTTRSGIAMTFVGIDVAVTYDRLALGAGN